MPGKPQLSARTIRSQRLRVELLATALAATASRLKCAVSDADTLIAARDEHILRAQLLDVQDWTRAVLRAGDDPTVRRLSRRVQVLLAVLQLVQDQYAEPLARGWAILRGDNGWEPDSRTQLRYGVRVVSGGAPGLGKRA